jgi:hypothetical protein
VALERDVGQNSLTTVSVAETGRASAAAGSTRTLPHGALAGDVERTVRAAPDTRIACRVKDET